ncbi:hypothetical protein VP01_723g2 [Puccinia sorghi]|uniref:Uncharacterized protein n=1 Tax=Puccinia sorghi TaxID=27349 RepID=A0A0L6UD47_9BASI|nr:hypothetical protein VP01_723g2 [Puccinia sorghi]
MLCTWPLLFAHECNQRETQVQALFKNLALGIMKDWYKGVLQHHWHVLIDWSWCTMTDWKILKTMMQRTQSLAYLQTWVTQNMASKWYSMFSTYLPLSLIDFFIKNIAHSLRRTCCTLKHLKSFLICQSFSQSSLCTSSSLKTVVVGSSLKCIQVLRQTNQWDVATDEYQWNCCLTEILFSGQIEWTVMQEFCQIQRFQFQTSALLLQKEHFALSIQPKQKKLNYEDGSLKHYQDGPHLDDANIFLYITKSKPNWLVAYLKDGKSNCVWVTHIYRLLELLVAIEKLDNPFCWNGSEPSKSFQRTLGDLGINLVCKGSEHLPAWIFKNHQPLVALQKIPHNLYLLLYSATVQ